MALLFYIAWNMLFIWLYIGILSKYCTDENIARYLYEKCLIICTLLTSFLLKKIILRSWCELRVSLCLSMLIQMLLYHGLRFWDGKTHCTVVPAYHTPFWCHLKWWSEYVALGGHVCVSYLCSISELVLSFSIFITNNGNDNRYSLVGEVFWIS